MAELYPFFIVLFAAVFFSHIFNRLHLPWVVALILGGIVIGPFGLDVLPSNQVVDFMGQIGLVFLMFIAGLETRIGDIQRSEISSIAGISILNGLIPFLAGFAIGIFFGLPYLSALLLGIVFISSSIAVVIPTLEEHGILGSRLGRIIVSTTMFQDIASLVLLSILLQSVSPVTTLPLYVFYILLVLVVIILRWSVPKLRLLFSRSAEGINALFNEELRIVFVLLIGTVIVFELLGLHPIIGGFFAGFILSDSITSEKLVDKLRVISYGLFIPIFFLLVGAQTDIGVLLQGREVLGFAAVVIAVSVLSKFLSGYVSSRAFSYSMKDSTLVGVSSIPQLSTTLAVVFTGSSLGIISSELTTALVALTVVTSLIAPYFIKVYARSYIEGLSEKN